MSEEKIKELYMELKSIEEAVNHIQQQMQMLLQQQTDMKSTVVALNQFETLNEDSEAYVPLSSGIFAKAVIKKPQELLVNVGAGVTVTKTIPDTRAVIQDQIADSEKFEKQMADHLQQLSKKGEDIKKQMKALMPK